MALFKSILTCAAVMTAVPAFAEEESEGKSLMQQGAEMFLKGLTEQMEPALEDLKSLSEEMGPQLRNFLAEMGPALGEVFEQVEDWTLYHPPEILPNGDIILRKRLPDAEKETAPEGPVDL